MTSFPTAMTKRIILIVRNSVVGGVLHWHFNELQHTFDARRTPFGVSIFSRSNSEACNIFLFDRLYGAGF